MILGPMLCLWYWDLFCVYDTGTYSVFMILGPMLYWRAWNNRVIYCFIFGCMPIHKQFRFEIQKQLEKKTQHNNNNNNKGSLRFQNQLLSSSSANHSWACSFLISHVMHAHSLCGGCSLRLNPSIPNMEGGSEMECARSCLHNAPECFP